MTATSSCLYAPYAINLNTIYSDTENYASAQDIAALTNLEDSRVYLYSGSKDWTVAEGMSPCLEHRLIYASFMVDMMAEIVIFVCFAFAAAKIRSQTIVYSF